MRRLYSFLAKNTADLVMTSRTGLLFTKNLEHGNRPE